MNPALIDLPDEIVGERVVLRPRGPGDGNDVWDAVEESRAEISPWLPWVKAQLSPEESQMSARRAYSKWISREDLAVVIRDRASDRFLGGSGLHRIDWDVPKFEIGYWLRTSAVGHGYVTETVKLLSCFAFDKLQANRVEIRCDSKNERSIAVPQRLGYVLEAHLRNDCLDNDNNLRDTLIYSLTPIDFGRVRERWDRYDHASG